MNEISPKYQMKLVQSISQALWQEYKSYADVTFYLEKWQIWYSDQQANFYIIHKNNDYESPIDLNKTLHNIDGETLLKIAIDLGVETPDFIPSIPTFKNEIKSNYKTAGDTFEKSYKCVDSDPDTSIGLANSALESIIKEILKDKRITVRWNDTNTLQSLVKSICKEFGFSGEGDEPEEIRKLNSALITLSQAIEGIRSSKTRFHGKTSDDYFVTDPMLATCVINSVATVGLFLISYYEKKYPKNTEYSDDLPF